jgi:ribosomal protein S18 acetylase RimI-like enzyme
MKIITAKPEHRVKILLLLRSLYIYDIEPVYAAIKKKTVKIAIEGNKTLGVIVYTVKKDRVYIEGLNVRYTHRRQGIGRKLVREVLKIAKRRRKKWVSLHTAFGYNAKAFYEKCGFYRTRTWADSWAMTYKVPYGRHHTKNQG